MSLDMDVLAISSDDIIDDFHFKGENLLGEVEPEDLAANGIDIYHTFEEDDYPVFAWMLSRASERGMKDLKLLADDFMRLSLEDIKALRLSILMNGTVGTTMKLAKGFDWRAYVRNGKIKDVGFCDCTEKFLEKNEDKALYVFFSW